MSSLRAVASAFPSATELRAWSAAALERCGVDAAVLRGNHWSTSPVTGARLHPAPSSGTEEIDAAVRRAEQAFAAWAATPAPARGALLKRFGQLLEAHQDDVARLITLEVGKLPGEARGEVNEMIDMCDFALGLSRQLYGRTVPSQRVGFRLLETWHPLGVVAVITPFCFPAAAWSWNAPLALVCGNPVIWKPSEHAPLTALACGSLLDRAACETGAPPFLSQVLPGGPTAGATLADHPRIALVSATASTETGRSIGTRVADRLGRSLLNLGGNNATVVAGSADLDLAVPGIVAAATSYAGQRCTTMRRLIAHHSIIEELLERLVAHYGGLTVGNPLLESTRIGPLLEAAAYERMAAALRSAEEQGGQVLTGGERGLAEEAPDAYYMRPALVRMPQQSAIVRQETMAPILHVLEYDELDEAIALNNAVPQGFSSSIFTTDQGEAERFLASDGSDCGVVNVNTHTSGAEIGTAFGGEKETGGGRQCGSDVWRFYMRRVTSAVHGGMGAR